MMPQSVARALESLGFPTSNVAVLRDAQATKGEIERILKQCGAEGDRA